MVEGDTEVVPTNQRNEPVFLRVQMHRMKQAVVQQSSMETEELCVSCDTAELLNK